MPNRAQSPDRDPLAGRPSRFDQKCPCALPFDPAPVIRTSCHHWTHQALETRVSPVPEAREHIAKIGQICRIVVREAEVEPIRIAPVVLELILQKGVGEVVDSEHTAARQAFARQGGKRSQRPREPPLASLTLTEGARIAARS